MKSTAWVETVLKCPFCDTMLQQPKPPAKIKDVTVWCPTCKTADFKSAQPNPARAARAPVHRTAFPRPLAPTSLPTDQTPEARDFPPAPRTYHPHPRQAPLPVNTKIDGALTSLFEKMHDAEHPKETIPAHALEQSPGLDRIRQIAITARAGDADQTLEREGLHP